MPLTVLSGELVLTSIPTAVAFGFTEVFAYVVLPVIRLFAEVDRPMPCSPLWWLLDPVTVTPILGYTQQDPFSNQITPIEGTPYQVNGFRLQDGRASYGIGLETFALGFPIHFDWSWRTLFNPAWEDYVYSYRAALDGDSSGSHWLRKPKFSIWIGYDF